MQLLGLTFILYVNNKLIDIRMLGDPLFQGSFPEGVFSFKASEVREKPWRKNGKMETNKQQNKIKQI